MSRKYGTKSFGSASPPYKKLMTLYILVAYISDIDSPLNVNVNGLHLGKSVSIAIQRLGTTPTGISLLDLFRFIQ